MTPHDQKRAQQMLITIRVLVRLDDETAEFIANGIAGALAHERREFCERVSDVVDSGKDTDDSFWRLNDLLNAEIEGEDPDTFGRFAAPPSSEPGE